MSWSFSIPVNSKEQFEASVDAATPAGQPLDSIGLDDDVAAAKAALKALAGRVKRPRVGGSASGHCLQPSEGAGMSDSIAVSVYGAD